MTASPPVTKSAGLSKSAVAVSTSTAMTTSAVVDLEEEETMPATPIRTPAKRRLGLGGPRLGDG